MTLFLFRFSVLTSACSAHSTRSIADFLVTDSPPWRTSAQASCCLTPALKFRESRFEHQQNLSPQQCGEFHSAQLADALDGDIGGRKTGDQFQVECIMPLPREDSCHF